MTAWSAQRSKTVGQAFFELLHKVQSADRAWHRVHIAFAILTAAIAVFIVSSTIEITILTTSPVVYWDQWQWVATLQSWLERGFSWSSLFAVQNEHRIATNRALLMIDYLVDQSTNRLLVVFNLFQYAAVIAALCIMQRLAARDRSGWIDALVYTAFVAIVLFPAANIVNLHWAFQAGTIFGYVGVVFACLMAIPAIEAAKSGNLFVSAFWYLLVAIVAFLATFAVTSSIFIWPLVIMMSWLGGASPRLIVGFALISLATIIFFFSGFQFASWGFNSDPYKTWNVLRTYYDFLPHYLGNIIVHEHQPDFRSWTLGWLGLICAGLAAVSLFAYHRKWSVAQLALFSVMVSVVITGWLIALARQIAGSLGMVVDRYHLAVGLFWAAALALAWSVPWRQPLVLWVRVIVGIAMLIIMVAISANQRSVLSRYLDQGRRWELAANALRTNIMDDNALSAIALGQPPSASVDFLRTRQLSVFADGRYRWIGQQLDQVVRPSVAICPGSVDRIDHISDVKNGWYLTGERESDVAAPSYLVVADETGKVAGFASAIPTAWDWLRDRPDGTSRWEGFTSGEPGATRSIYAVRPDGTCRMATIQLPA